MGIHSWRTENPVQRFDLDETIQFQGAIAMGTPTRNMR